MLYSWNRCVLKLVEIGGSDERRRSFVAFLPPPERERFITQTSCGVES